jgi:hypothetical protein
MTADELLATAASVTASPLLPLTRRLSGWLVPSAIR